MVTPPPLMAPPPPPQHQQHQQRQRHRVSQASRLSYRWNQVFRAEHGSLYDSLLFRPVEWPAITLQWQPGAWAPPPPLAELAEAAAEEQQAAAAAAEEEAEAAAGGGMEVDGEGSSGGAGREPVAMPLRHSYLLLGTQSAGEECAVALCRVALPGPLPPDFDPRRQRLVTVGGEISLVLSIPHGELDVNRVASMPSNPSVVAACSDRPEVRVYDLRRHQQQPRQQPQLQDGAGGGEGEGGTQGGARGSPSPQGEAPRELAAVLRSRVAGGFALEWNPEQPGLLLGGDLGGGVQLWDVERGAGAASSGGGGGGVKDQGALLVLGDFSRSQDGSPCAINDVSWHRGGALFAAACESGALLLQDVRAPGPAAAACPSPAAAAAALPPDGLQWEQVHVQRGRRPGAGRAAPDALCVAFDPAHPHRLASGGCDGYVAVLDVRRLSRPLERLALHAGDVRQVAWSAGAPGLLASGGEDGHVLLWDANRMRHAAAEPPGGRPAQGQQPGLGLPPPARTQLSRDVERLLAPGLLFPHHGHLAQVDALAFHPERPWTLASASPAAHARDGGAREVEVQPATVMVWEANRSHGLLC